MQAVNKLMTLGEHTTVVLIPSIRDAHHLPVFPQPAMQIGGTENMVFLDNPASFSCQGSAFGVVSSDVLMPLSSQELRKGPTADRLASLAAKVIQQRRYATILWIITSSSTGYKGNYLTDQTIEFGFCCM